MKLCLILLGLTCLFGCNPTNKLLKSTSFVSEKENYVYSRRMPQHKLLQLNDDAKSNLTERFNKSISTYKPEESVKIKHKTMYIYLSSGGDTCAVVQAYLLKSISYFKKNNRFRPNAIPGYAHPGYIREYYYNFNSKMFCELQDIINVE